MSNRLKPFVTAMLEAEKAQNNYAAIALALTLPDICGSVDDPGIGKSKARYVKWWNTYASEPFDRLFPKQEEAAPLIAGDDAWALRNAFLHAGQDRWEEPESDGRRRIRKVRFIHCQISSLGSDQSSGTLYVAIDLFVASVGEAIENWLNDRSSDEQAQTRLKDLLEIMSPDEFYDVFIDNFAID